MCGPMGSCDRQPEQIVERVLHCDNCGCNIFEHGITEVTYGGTSETSILFDPGTEPGILLGETSINNFDYQVAYCRNCNKVFCNGEVSPSDIIEFYEGRVEYLESYLEFKGGAPVHGWVM